MTGSVHTRGPSWLWVTSLLACALVSGCRDGDEAASAVQTGPVDPFRDIGDAKLMVEVQEAHAMAGQQGKRVLLDFVASWCEDCREVIRVSALAPAADVIRERYVHVPVNVGRWDRATALRERFRIDRIATLVVLEPDGTRVAQTTLEPITNHQPLTAGALAAWLREPRDGPAH